MTIYEQIAENVFNLFVNRADVYARQFLIKGKKAFKKVQEPISLDLIKNHLEGKDFLGVYQLNLENQVRWGCFDFDKNTSEDYDQAKLLYTSLKASGFNPLMELSGGGDYKVHVWILSAELIPAVQMQKFMIDFCNKVNVHPHEIFPKQIEIGSDGYGNLLKLPFGKHLETKRTSMILDNNFKEILSYDEIAKLLDMHLSKLDIIPTTEEPQQKVLSNIPEIKTEHKFDKFFNAILRKELPAGITKEIKIGGKEAGINNNLLKNEARWFYEKGYSLEQLEEEVKPIFETNGWAWGDLKGWYKKAQKGEILEINQNELYLYCKDFAPELIDLLPDAQKKDDFFTLEVYSDSDLKDYKPEPQAWLIENQIPKGEVGLIVGKRGERKTFTALKQVLCLTSGQDCFEDKVPEKKKVLIIDEESGKNELAKRMLLLKKGMDLNDSLDIKYISFQGLKLDRYDKKLEQLYLLLEEYQPDLIIIDCLARVVTFEVDKDNASISALFTEVVRPMINKYKSTWLFIHHLRKGMNGQRPDDPLDEVRGGSELVNYCRFVLMCQAPRGQIKGDDGSEYIIFKVLKMSNSQIPEPKVIAFTPNEDCSALSVTYAGQPEEILSGEVQAGSKIKEYLISEGITGEFKTKDIVDAGDKIGFKKSLLHQGLGVLFKEGFLDKIKRGVWRVKGLNPEVIKIK